MIRLLANNTIAAVLLGVFILSSAACVYHPSNTRSVSAGRLPSITDVRSGESSNADFIAYRLAVSQQLSARLMPQRTPRAIALNLPFELTADPGVPFRGRYLLLHGLNDSPYVWRPMAQELASRGFDVRAILFDGHGTTPEDMLNVRWEWWMSTAREHLAAWSDKSIPMYLGGFSMGAVIATWLALDNPSVDGLLLVSPAYESKLNHYLRWSGLYARFRPWVFGGMILEDNPIKYNSIPVNSGWQFYQLTRALKRRWNRTDRIRIPTLMVMSEDDSVVDTRYTKKLFKHRFVSLSSRLLSYSASHSLVDLDTSAHSRMIYRSSVFPSRRILNQSHLGLMYPPDDVLFGESAQVLVCNGNEYPIFMACMRSGKHWYGAQHTPSPDGVPVARTTYNADWSAMLELMDQVFSGKNSG